MLLEHLALVGELVRLAPEVGPVGQPGHDAQGELLAPSSDEDGRMRTQSLISEATARRHLPCEHPVRDSEVLGHGDLCKHVATMDG